MITRFFPFLGKFLITFGVASGSIATYQVVTPKVIKKDNTVEKVNVSAPKEEVVESVEITDHVSVDLQKWVFSSECVRNAWRFGGGGATADILICTSKSETNTKEYTFFLSKQLSRYGKGEELWRRQPSQEGWYAAFSKNEKNQNYLKVYDSLGRLRVATELEEVLMESQDKTIHNLYRTKWPESFEDNSNPEKNKLLNLLKDKAKELTSWNSSYES